MIDDKIRMLLRKKISFPYKLSGSRSWAVSSQRVRSDFSQEPIGPKVVTQVPGPESLQLLKQLDKIQVKWF